MTTLPFPFWFRSIGTFLPSGLASVLGDRRRDHEEAGLVPAQDLVAKATQAAREAQNLPPGPERIEAMKKADGLRHAADTYNYLFSCELKRPD